MTVNKVPEIVNIIKLCIIYCWQYKNLIFDLIIILLLLLNLAVHAIMLYINEKNKV